MSETLPRLICLGNITIDDVYLPDGKVEHNSIGGDALYAALAAKLWEPRVQMVAPVGDDFPVEIESIIRQAGFKFDGLPKRDIPTLHNRVYYHDDGGRRWENLFTAEDFYHLSPLPLDIPPDYHQAQAFLILAMALEAQEQLVAWLSQHTEALVVLDTQEDYVEGNEKRILSMLESVDIFLPSTAEVISLLGHDNWLAAAREFASLGPDIVVIKQGEDGSLVYDKRKQVWYEQKPIPVEVVDATGAGDAYCGGFLAGYLKYGKNLKVAVKTGAISASYAIASFGMQALLSVDQEVLQKNLDHFMESL
jgi:ribokinase